MATIHGSVGAFDSQVESWTSYTERLEQYFLANDVLVEEKKRAILLSNCGPQTYDLLKNLTAPDKPATKSFADIVSALQNHYQPKPSIIVQRFMFHSRAQKQGETVAEYVAELKRLAEHCGFDTVLNDMLRDRLVCGIVDERIQRRLLAEPTLTFQKAFELAQAAETADRNLKELKADKSSLLNLKVTDSSSARRNGKKTSTATSGFGCYRCGDKKHAAADCRFKTVNCRNCGKLGHIAKACRSKGNSQSRNGHKSNTHRVTTEDTDQSGTELETEYSLYKLSNRDKGPLLVRPIINKKEVVMEVDTGAAMSIICSKTYHSLWSDGEMPPLTSANCKLKTYTGEQIKVLGKIDVMVALNNQTQPLQLLVVDGEGPSLLGRDWLGKIKLDWKQLCIHHTKAELTLQDILAKHATVFGEGLGCVQGVQAKIHIKPNTQPKFWRARSVPFAVRKRVEEELDRLLDEGVISPVQHSEWATPIVPVVKKNGTIRICGDYKVTLNRVAVVESYPLPRIDDLVGSLAGGQLFSKLDLAHAYQQIQLEESARILTTINTHRGLFQYNRLPFGVSSAPAIFQRIMESILQGLPQVSVYIDDILVTGSTKEQHLRNLDEVLWRLKEAGLRLKRDKCNFLLPEVEYLGHVITTQGLKPSQKKIQAIRSAPAPQNVSQLRSFLGLVNYYQKFLGNLSSTLAPLHKLLQKAVKWNWGDAQARAFQEIKRQLTSPPLLASYNPEKELTLSCDASPYGLGAVLSQLDEDGFEKPVAYASRSLAPAERRYSHLDKEALALVFGVKKFHNYLFGRIFTLISDHKPLKHILGETQPVPTLASARLQRWALILGAYSYTIKYKPGQQNSNADALSRLPLSDGPKEIPVPGETILLIENLKETPVTFKQIATWTSRHPLLSQVRHQVLQGWNANNEDPKLLPYTRRKAELTTLGGCLLWGSRVIVPPAGREAILNTLHEGHPGISRMKSKARGFVWWPSLDKDIEEKVKHCGSCQRTRHTPAQVPISSWEWPKDPWRRLHIDYAGPFHGKMFLLIIDAHSKWLDVCMVNSATSKATTEKLRSVFATHGLPEVIVSDNGAVFTSEEFQVFVQRNGIKHLKTPPYHPASNGQVERVVQVFKEAIKKMSTTSTEPLVTQLARFLFNYRTTPHTTTGVTPAELLMGRQLRSHLSLVYPSIATQVQDKQQQQRDNQHKGAKDRVVKIGDAVFVKDLPHGSEWLAGVVKDRDDSKSFRVELSNGRIIRRHIDHIRPRTSIDTDHSNQASDDDLCDLVITPNGNSSTLVEPLISNEDLAPIGRSAPLENLTAPHSGPPVPRRSSRVRKVPSRFAPTIGH